MGGAQEAGELAEDWMLLLEGAGDGARWVSSRLNVSSWRSS